MNLKAFFNKNYFKENIRKSKGLLAFFFGVVPLINILIFIVVLSSGNSTLVDFNSISIVTYLGLFFIPIVLSISLFGFIFKKKSVDFVMSKPINRKSIFLTNTIGGIALIILFMLINTLICGLFSLISANLVIPFNLLLDYFIFWTVSYIFLFIVSNLCVSLAGNFIMSIILILIVICLIPFLGFTRYFFSDYYNYDNYIKCTDEECIPDNYYCYDNENCIEHLSNDEYSLSFSKEFTHNYPAPLLSTDATGTLYNGISLIKMIILSIIYAIIGYFIFKRRKMENNETDFRSEFAHYLVKTITLIPVCLLTYLVLLETDAIGWLIALAIVIIYYIVYDLIVRREIYKLRKSLLIALISFGIITGVYAGWDSLSSKSTTIEKVDKIILNSNWDNLEITNTSLINQVIKTSLESSEVYYVTDATMISGNKSYSFMIVVTSELESMLDQLVIEDNKKKLEEFNYNSIDYIDYQNTKIPVTNEIKSLLKDNLDSIVDNFNENSSLMTIYNYNNHQYQKLSIPVRSNAELYNIVISYQNEEFMKKLEKYKGSLDLNLNVENYEIFTEEDVYVFSYVINSNKEAFIKYMNTENDIDMNGDNASIGLYINNYIRGSISDLTEFKKEFDTYKENIKDNAEYQSLLNEYKEMKLLEDSYEY